jgi:hypothetical protein
MAFPIIPIRNAIATSQLAPLAQNLQFGELAINSASGKLYAKVNSALGVDGVIEVGGTANALTTNDISQLAVALKIPQLTTAGHMPLVQLSGLTTAEMGPALTTAPVSGLIPLLGIDGKIPSTMLPAGVAGALTYKGAWTVNTSPVITAVTAGGVAPATGDYYVAATDGTVGGLGNNITQILVGDMIAWNGTKWDLIHGARNEVVSLTGVGGTTLTPVNGSITVTPANIGALSTAQITELSEAGKVPQLNALGQISTTQLQIATTAQLGILSIDPLSTNGLFISGAGAAKVIPGTSTVVGGVKSSASIEIAVDGTATVASAGTY